MKSTPIVVEDENALEQEIMSLLETCFLNKSTRQNRSTLSNKLTNDHVDQLIEKIKKHPLNPNTEMNRLLDNIVFSANKLKEETKTFYHLALALYAIEKLLTNPEDKNCQRFFSKTCQALDPLFTGKDALQMAMIALAEAVIGAGFVIAGAPIIPVAATLGAVVGLTILAKAVHCLFFKRPSDLSKDMSALKEEMVESVVEKKF